MIRIICWSLDKNYSAKLKKSLLGKECIKMHTSFYLLCQKDRAWSLLLCWVEYNRICISFIFVCVGDVELFFKKSNLKIDDDICWDFPSVLTFGINESQLTNFLKK